MDKKAEVFQLIYNYMYNTYDIPYVNMDTNIYTDLGFNEFQKYELFDHIKKELHIKEIPLRYFSSIEVLCDVVAKVLINQELEQKKKELRQQHLQNSKTYQAIIWLKTKFNGK